MDLGPPTAVAIAIAGALTNWFRQSASDSRAQGAAAALIDARFKDFEQRLTTLRAGDEEMRVEFKQAVQELRNVATQITVLNAEQSVINRVTTSALQGLAENVAKHDRTIAEHGATLKALQRKHDE